VTLGAVSQPASQPAVQPAVQRSPSIREDIGAVEAQGVITTILTVAYEPNKKGAPARKQVRPLGLRVLESYQLRQLRPQRGEVLRRYNASRGVYGRKAFGIKIWTTRSRVRIKRQGEPKRKRLTGGCSVALAVARVRDRLISCYLPASLSLGYDTTL